MMQIPYGKQHITPEDIEAVAEVLQADFLTQGPKIDEFEAAFADYVGAKYAVAVANGTAALHLCALALDVKESSRVITSPITFAASANCIGYCGGQVDFCDIDPESFCIDLERLRDRLASAPMGTYSGIIPVDYAGYPVNMEAIRNIADEYGLWIIEDACHAPGGEFLNAGGTWSKCGSGAFADLAIFSFHPVKHIACGEGGMITTNDENLYRKLLLLRTHGITKDPELMEKNPGGWYYEMQVLGYNYRLTDMQAALGLSQLQRAGQGLDRRRAIARRYDEAFANGPVQIPVVTANVRHAYHLYVIRTERRKELYDYLRENGIFAQVHYIPVHTLPYYRGLGWKVGDFPIAEGFYEKCLSLPMYPSLSDAEQAYVIEKIMDFFA